MGEPERHLKELQRVEAQAEFWERRYNTQHRTLHSCEDALAESRAEAEALRNAAAKVPELERTVRNLSQNYREKSAEAEALREALRQIADHYPERSWAGQIARTALSEGSGTCWKCGHPIKGNGPSTCSGCHPNEGSD